MGIALSVTKDPFLISWFGASVTREQYLFRKRRKGVVANSNFNSNTVTETTTQAHKTKTTQSNITIMTNRNRCYLVLSWIFVLELVWCPVALSFCPNNNKNSGSGCVVHSPAALVPSQRRHDPFSMQNEKRKGFYKYTTPTPTALRATASGIDELPSILQAIVFFGSYIGLGIGTAVTTKLLDVYSTKGTPGGLVTWRTNVIDGNVLQSLLGLFYATAGIGHFVNAQGFRDIYPPLGTWGIWYLPGSASFHVAWTGLVELLGGTGLLVAAYLNANGILEEEEEETTTAFLPPQLVQPASASLLFLLTILVTPANIYMFTHGASMGNGGDLGLNYHLIRFGIQILLLSFLLVLTKDSLVFLWADELD